MRDRLGDVVTIDELRERVDSGIERAVADLDALVRIASVSLGTFDQAHVRASADAVAELLAGAGIRSRVTSSPGPGGEPGRPAVLGTREGKGELPTVLLYAHHDVQPPGDASLWTQDDPFTPDYRGERMFGRGSADDKAGIVAHLGAIRALGQDLRAGLRVFIEGEEEIGSPSFASFLEAHHEELAADVIIVLDSSNWKVGIPALTTSLRGLVEARVQVRVLDHAVHSGMYGGPILDAPTLMCRLLASLHDHAGDVAVAGLHSYEAAPVAYPDEGFRADAGVLPGVHLAGTGSLPSRLWTKPALSIVGMDVTSVAGRSNTIQPSCTAALSLRIAPGDDPARAFEALRTHLEQHAPFGADVTVTLGELGPAYRADGESEVTALAHRALSEAWGTESVEIGIGGSIPFIAELQAQFPGTDVLVTGIEDPDSRAHSEDESMHLGELKRAILAEAILLARLSGTLTD